MALRYLYNSPALLSLFIEKNEDIAKARTKNIIGKASFLNPWSQAVFFISQNESKAMRVKEYTEFAQG